MDSSTALDALDTLDRNYSNKDNMLLTYFFCWKCCNYQRIYTLSVLGFAAEQSVYGNKGNWATFYRVKQFRFMSKCSVESSIAVLQSFSLSLILPFVLFMGQCKWLFCFSILFRLFPVFLLSSTCFFNISYDVRWCAVMLCDVYIFLAPRFFYFCP